MKPTQRHRILTVAPGLLVLALLAMVPAGGENPATVLTSVPTLAQPTASPMFSDGRTTARRAIEIWNGQSDRKVISLIPHLDLSLLVQPHPPVELPVIRFVGELDDISKDTLREGASLASISDVLESPALPDTLILFSGDWYGDKLRQAAEEMELGHSPKIMCLHACSMR